MEAAERGCSGRPDPKETGRPNPTGNYCVFFPTGCFSPPNFSRRLSISPKMHFLLLKRIFLSAPQAKKIFDPPSPGCFAPPDVFPPPKNFGRVGGEKHAVITSSRLRGSNAYTNKVGLSGVAVSPEENLLPPAW